MSARTYRFAAFLLDLGRHRLTGPAGEIDLRPKSFEVLVRIVERAGQVVTKEELTRGVWPRVVVTDESLTRCVSDVRLALGDRDRTLIRTVPGLGYRLDAEVVAGQADGGRPESSAPSGEAARDPAPVEGGRRHATALYVDIREDVERATLVDPEGAMARYESVLARVSEVFRRFGATIQVMPGEGVVGLFGVPLAQEDHALRACHGALACHESAGRWTGNGPDGSCAGVRLKIGVASGPVIFRSLAGVPEQAWTAMGATIDQSRRLGRLAEPGATLISERTRRLVDGHVVVSRADLAEGDPVPGACRLDGPIPFSTRFGAALSRGLTPFVGRDDERGQLERAGRLAAQGRCQVVAVVGEAGAGKSRLVHEFTSALQRQERWRVLACTAASYGKATSYLPIVDLFRRYFGIEAGDGMDVIRDRIRAGIHAAGAPRDDTAPALLQLLDVPTQDSAWDALDPGERRRRTIDAVRGILSREARERPLLLVVEDLHWVDAGTQALLEGLVDGMGAERLCLVVTCRPECRHGWAAKTCFTQVRLDVLDADRTGEMLDALLGDHPTLSRLKHSLNAHGNPFFLEEAVRTLAEEGALEGSAGSYRLARPVEAVRIPATVQAMLAARIDRLEPRCRRILEIASMIGERVPLPLLALVAGEPDDDLQRALDRLQAAELLDQVGVRPDAAFAFRHALIQDVAASGLLQDRLRALHAATLRAIETLYRDRLGEHVERLAHHARGGGLHEQATHYLRLSGFKAASLSALVDARHWYEQALEANGLLPDSTATLERGVDIRLELRGVLYQLGEARALQAHLREAQSIAGRLGDARRQSRVASFMTSIHTMLGDLDEAVDVGDRSLAAARELDDLELRTNASNYLVQAAYYRGDYRRVLDLARDSLANWPDEWAHKYHPGNPAPASVFNRAFIAVSLAQQGRFREAALHETRALELAEPTRSAFTIAVAHVPVPTLYPLMGEWETATTRLERYIAVARTGNLVGLLSTATAASAWVLAERGEATEADRRIEEACRLLERQARHGVGTLAWAFYSLGRAFLALGRLDEALRCAERALAVSASQRGFAAYAHELHGAIAGRRDRPDVASGERHYRQALALARPRGMRPLSARCHRGLAALNLAKGRIGRSRAHESIAARIEGEMLIEEAGDSWL